MIVRRKRYFKVMTILMAAVFFLAACGRPAAGPQTKSAEAATNFQISDGPPAPDWTLETLDGQTFELADHKGDVVVMFFMASWCSSCILEARALDQLYKDYADQGLTVVAINVEPEKNAESLAQFRQQSFDAPYAWTFDNEFKVTQLYGVKALDTTFVIDRAGNIAYNDAYPTPYETLKKEVEKWL